MLRYVPLKVSKASMILLTALVLASEAKGQTLTPQIGQRVVTKYQTPLKLGGQVVNDDRTLRIYTVEEINGKLLKLAAYGVRGWVP